MATKPGQLVLYPIPFRPIRKGYTIKWLVLVVPTIPINAKNIDAKIIPKETKNFKLYRSPNVPKIFKEIA